MRVKSRVYRLEKRGRPEYTRIHECGERISACTRTHTHIYVYTGQHRDRVFHGRHRVFLFRRWCANRARQVRGQSANTCAHVYTTANREFIFYGELNKSFRGELCSTSEITKPIRQILIPRPSFRFQPGVGEDKGGGIALRRKISGVQWYRNHARS